MSSFYLFSPEPSEIDADDELNRSETFTPQPIQKEQIKPAKLKQKRQPKKTHPSYAVMVDEAVYNMGVYKKGLSLFTVKKFLKEKYDLNMKYGAKRIRSVIKDCLESGRYVQTTGRGLNGCFRLGNNTRRSLNTKFKEHPTKSLRINIKTKKNKTTLENKRNHQNVKDSALLKGNLKRKAVPKRDKSKRARTESPAIMKAMG